MANFKFEFVISGLTAEQAERLMDGILVLVDLAGGLMGGGYAQADADGLLPGEADDTLDAAGRVGAG